LSGSSCYFRGGIITYQTEIKETVLGVDHEIILHHGVVSPETADSMRRQACLLFKTDYAISITGYAGPTGGTDIDPVGTAYVSVGSLDHSLTTRIESHCQARNDIQDDFAQQAITLLLGFINRKTP